MVSMRHFQLKLDTGMEKLGDIPWIGAFFVFTFRTAGGNIFSFSLIACFNALAKSHGFFIQALFDDTESFQCDLPSYLSPCKLVI